MSELSDKQHKFSRLLPRLLDFIHAQGYEVSGGEWWRSDETAKLNAEEGKGISNSLHRLRLAVDLNLIRDGQFLTKPEDYVFAGTYWKSLDPDCCFGGDFKDAAGNPKPDADHFSIQHDGVK